MSSNKKVYIAMLCLLGISVLGAAAGVYKGNSYLSEKSKRIVDLKIENEKIEQQQTALIKAKKDIEKYKTYNDIAKQIVPQDKDEIRAILEINELAKESGITLSNISLPTSTLGQKVATPKPAADAGGTTAPAAPAPASVSQATAVEGLTGVLQLKLIITPASGGYSYSQFLSFLEKLEKNRRTAQITKVTTSRVDDTSPNLTFVLELSIYLKPGAGASQ